MGFLRVFFHFFVEIFAVPPVGQDRLRSVKIDRAFKPLKRQILMVFLLFFLNLNLKFEKAKIPLESGVLGRLLSGRWVHEL